MDYRPWFSGGFGIGGVVLAALAALYPAFIAFLVVGAATCWTIGGVLWFRTRHVRHVQPDDPRIVGMFAFDQPGFLVDITASGEYRAQPLITFHNASRDLSITWSIDQAAASFGGNSVLARSPEESILAPLAREGFRVPAALIKPDPLPLPVQVRLDVVVTFGLSSGGQRRRVERGVSYQATILGDKQALIERVHVVYSRELTV